MKTVNSEIIKKNVFEQLKWDSSVDAENINISVSDGTVWLDGIVKSYVEKISATKDAFHVRGVRHVNNNLEVHLLGESELPDDEQITKNVNHALHWNSDIESKSIIVETSERIVTLRGTVTTFWERYKAEDLANQTVGAKGVINLLEVKLAKTVADLDIENDIKKAYERSMLIDEDKIEVKVNSGVARLMGHTANYLTKKEAVNLAAYTEGVVNVIDELSIE